MNCTEQEQGRKKMNRIEHKTKLKHRIERTEDVFMNSYGHGDERNRWKREKTCVVEELG